MSRAADHRGQLLRRISLFAALLLCVMPGVLQAQAVDAATRATEAASKVASTWDKSTGLFQGTGWWNSANGITALVNTSRATASHPFDSLIAKTFATANKQHPGFINEFYDDEGWWALAWLDAYQLTRDPQYLDMSQKIFLDMQGGWSDTCGGGIWWKKNEHYKNAIANELFLSVATGLAQEARGKERLVYRNWAEREARWFLHSGMINADSLVNDGLDDQCHNNGRATWTYNQGVLLTGLAQLSALQHQADLLDEANRIAHAAMQHLADSEGILHDSCEPKCGADGVQFKGIFMRNLQALDEQVHLPAYSRFLRANAESVWTKARTADGFFSVDWSGPAMNSGTGSLISALDALNAAAGASSGTDAGRVRTQAQPAAR